MAIGVHGATLGVPVRQSASLIAPMIKVPANKSNPFGTPAYKRILQVGRNRRNPAAGRGKITKLTAASSSPGLPMMPMSGRARQPQANTSTSQPRTTIVYRFVFDKFI